MDIIFCIECGLGYVLESHGIKYCMRCGDNHDEVLAIDEELIKKGICPRCNAKLSIKNQFKPGTRVKPSFVTDPSRYKGKPRKYYECLGTDRHDLRWLNDQEMHPYFMDEWLDQNNFN